MARLTQTQFRLSLAMGLVVYASVMAGIVAWVNTHGQTAVQERIKATPQVTISLAAGHAAIKGQAAIPPSWQKKPLSENTLSHAAATHATQPAVPEPVPATEAASPAPQATAQPATPPAMPPQAKTWQKYAQSFDQADTRPRIGLVVTDLGLTDDSVSMAIESLPGMVTLGFSSLSPELEAWISKARVAGHEAVLTIPMEPENYPRNDPGPDTLLLALPDQENLSRLRRTLARSEGYVAVMPSMGEKFVTSEEKMAPVMAVLKKQGLIMLDGTANKNSFIPPLARLEAMPYARSDVLVDPTLSGQGIEEQLALLEKTAKEKGAAIGIALPYPVTFQKLKAWAQTLDKKGIALAPLTALITEQAGE